MRDMTGAWESGVLTPGQGRGRQQIPIAAGRVPGMDVVSAPLGGSGSGGELVFVTGHNVCTGPPWGIASARTIVTQKVSRKSSCHIRRGTIVMAGVRPPVLLQRLRELLLQRRIL